MSKLTAKERHALPPKDFALPGGRYPIEDHSHAQNALARVSQYGTPAEKSHVRAAVARKYPGMGHQQDPLTDAMVGQEMLKHKRK